MRPDNSPKQTPYSGASILLPGENADEYKSLVEATFDQWKPTNIIEETFVLQMVYTLWRLNREEACKASVMEHLDASNVGSLCGRMDQINRRSRELTKQYKQLQDLLMFQRDLFPKKTKSKKAR